MATNVSSIGTGKDYTTITAWESAVQGDLVSAGDIEKGECYNETFNERVVIDGSTTDASNYMWLTAASGEEHDGTSHSGARIEPSSGSGHIIEVDDSFLLIENLELDLTNDTTNSDECIRMDSASDLTIRRCLIYTEDTTPTAQQDGIYLNQDSPETKVLTIENCIIYGFARGGIHLQNWNIAGRTWTIHIRNCIIYNCAHDNDTGGIFAREFSTSNVTINCNNTLSLDNDSGTGTLDYKEYLNETKCTWNGDRNIASDTSATGKFGAGTGVGNMNSRTITTNTSPGAGDWVVVANLTAGSEDFHLQSSAENDAEGNGLDLSGNFTDDIDGDTRSDWDIGADEIVDAAGRTTKNTDALSIGMNSGISHRIRSL